MKKISKAFKPRARLLLQLGDQLIKDEGIALFELVKNAYDADATYCKILLSNIDDKRGEIRIEDNGCGMDIDIIEQQWLEPGTDYKTKAVNKLTRTPVYYRLPLGDKGIGRFGVHKIGSEITLISKKINREEIVLNIDWDDFLNKKYLDEVPIKVSERSPEYFTGSKTGTLIIIKRLWEPWNKMMYRNTHRAITSICSAFNTPDSFEVDVKLESNNGLDWDEGLMKPEKVIEYSLFYAKGVLSDNMLDLEYEFRPWDSMNKLAGRTFSESSKIVAKIDRDQIPINLSEHAIGKINFEFFIFDRDPRTLDLLPLEGKKEFKDYLTKNGGIRVYRDGIRIYDYGEPGDDWLSLDYKRFQGPTKTISNNQILGSVYLSREDSKDLIEKTNREGFISNKAFDCFRLAVSYAISQAQAQRNIDKLKIRNVYDADPKSEPVLSDLKELKDKINEVVNDVDAKKEIFKYLDRVEHDYLNYQEILIGSAGAGLSLGIVIHEVEKIIKELLNAVAFEKASPRVIKLSEHLSKLIEGYGGLAKNSKNEKSNLKDIIEQAIFNCEYRLRIHNIQIINNSRKYDGDTNLKVPGKLVISSIMNIIDNSIWWLDYKGGNEKIIFIDFTEDISNSISIIIADNGPGFSLPKDYLTKPFVSKKPEGMGLGLHIVDEAMKLVKGKLEFPEKGDVSLPRNINGAIVALSFPRGKK